MSEPVVRVEIQEEVAHVVLNRPDKRNAINQEVIEGLFAAFSEIQVNPAVHVVVLRGEGAMFSSGIDMNWLGALAGNDARQMGPLFRVLVTKIQETLNLIERVEKPVVAVLHGLCQGLGLELALACDFRIAAEEATISLPEVVLGLIPDCGGTTRVTRIAGPAVAKEVIFLCERLPARRYAEWNLITRVCPAADLARTVADFVALLRDRPLHVLGIAKRLIDRGANLDKMTHMEMEALANSILVQHPLLPQVMMEGFGKLRKK
jgi:enoyl-CoA hydratase/carnithine racemase